MSKVYFSMGSIHLHLLSYLRSGKHDSSSALTHHEDFVTALELHPEFKKPIVIITVDGGPDENPRFPKILAYHIQKFKDYQFMPSSAQQS
jgi:peptidoglycan/xylan/chitin deacetylase (PgdA/CDA1 family)